ncbi:hypothetical protein Nmel_005393, partial [Mimus melanotis]
GLCGLAGEPCRAARKAACPASPSGHTHACSTIATSANLWHRTKPGRDLRLFIQRAVRPLSLVSRLVLPLTPEGAGPAS